MSISLIWHDDDDDVDDDGVDVDVDVHDYIDDDVDVIQQVPVDVDKPDTAYKWHDDLWTSLLKASESLLVNVAGPEIEDLHKGEYHYHHHHHE